MNRELFAFGTDVKLDDLISQNPDTTLVFLYDINIRVLTRE